MRFDDVIGNMAEQNDLGMTRLLGKPARDCHCLAQGQSATKFVFSGMGYLSKGEKIGFLKLFERDTYFGIAEHTGIRSTNCDFQFGHGQTFGMDIPCAFEPEITVWSDTEGLIEFGREGEVDVE
jgi:hypothetical protein